MPRCLHPNVALLNDQARQALRTLARRDSFAVPLSAKDGCVPIYRRPKGDKITDTFPQSIWTKLVALSLVEPSSNSREWGLTEIGRATAKASIPNTTQSRSSKRSSNERTVGKVQARVPTPPTPQVNDEESPLSWLARRKGRDGKPMVSASQFAAGERLRRDFSQANLNPKVTMDWSMALSASSSRRHGAGPGRIMMSDAVASARTRVNDALSAVGPELSSILIDVCCHLKGLEISEQQAGWPKRSGKVILLLALTSLARHYGMNEGEDGSQSCKVRHWGQVGYRPELS